MSGTVPSAISPPPTAAEIEVVVNELGLLERSDKIGTAKRRDKIGTVRRRRSVLADGDFIRDLKAKGFFPPIERRVSRVVGVTNHLPISLPCNNPDSRKPAPKPWRDVGEEVRGLFFHKAMEGEPNVKGFTLMLSRRVEALARSKGAECLAWLHKRLVRKLRPLGERYNAGAAPFWFTIEESRAGRLHIHGEISLGEIAGDYRTVRQIRRVLAPLRKALKAAGGQWDPDRDGEGTQLRFARGKPNFRWAGYCLKSAQKARPSRRRYMQGLGVSDIRWLAGFDGNAVTASEGLAQPAKLRHAETMGLINTIADCEGVAYKVCRVIM